jgi:hypothetical protein
MSQMSNVFIILWQTKIHEYDNTIESKEKLWKEIGNGYGTIGKQHAGKLMGKHKQYDNAFPFSNPTSYYISMASTVFMFIHCLFFRRKANGGASQCQHRGSNPGRQFEGWLKEPLGLTSPIVHTLSTRLKKV